MTATSPRIYVASLADYNAGRLHGRWIDAAQDANEIHEEIRAMLAESREPIAEEWAIHDYDGFDGLNLGEYESIERVAEIALAIEEHGPALAAFLELDRSRDPSEFGDYYAGQWDSEKDFAYSYVEDTGGWSGLTNEQIDEFGSYVDWDAITRDLFMDGYTSVRAGAPDYGIFVFRDNA